MTRDIEIREGEGGAAHDTPVASGASLSGSAAQVEWAERIRRQVDADFDRVAAAFRAIARKQSPDKRAGTEAVIAILEEKRSEVMSRNQAGYFIHDWQETGDRVRQMISKDARYRSRETSGG